jgi:transposase-like protein
MAGDVNPLKEKPGARHVPTGIVVAPGGLISLRPDETLHWEIDPDRVRWKKPTDNLLKDFISLWQKRPQDIVRFAEKWGALRIDQGGNMLPPAGEGTEPLSMWIFFSRRAYSVLRISKALRAGEVGDLEDWKYLSTDAGGNKDQFFGMPSWSMRGMKEFGGKQIPVPFDNDVPFPVDRLCDQIAGELSEWLRRFTVHLAVDWGEAHDWRLQTRYSNGLLLSAIGLQLTLAVADADSLFICSACKKLYIRPRSKRKPNAGQANFCDDCGDNRRPEREAEKRYRENRREARRLATGGVSVTDIANKLGKTTTVIRGWLKKGKR